MNCLRCRLKIAPSNAHYGLHPKCFIKWFDAPIHANFVNLQRKSSASSNKSDNLTPENTSFFHGKFKKYSATLNEILYILKMRQESAPELPEVEYLCNQIGKSLDVPVAEFYFINFNGNRTFVTKNFIMPKTGPIDLQHIYHFRPDDKHSCEGLISLIIKQTQQPHEVKTFIKTVLFDSLIGNHDRHGRNLAFIKTAKNISLSPIYDNVSYLSLESGNMLKADFDPKGRISTSKTFEPSMHDYVKELKKLGFKDEVEKFYKSVKLPRLNRLIDKSFCSPLMKEAFKKLIRKRFKALKNELSN